MWYRVGFLKAFLLTQSSKIARGSFCLLLNYLTLTNYLQMVLLKCNCNTMTVGSVNECILVISLHFGMYRFGAQVRTFQSRSVLKLYIL